MKILLILGLMMLFFSSCITKSVHTSWEEARILKAIKGKGEIELFTDFDAKKTILLKDLDISRVKTLYISKPSQFELNEIVYDTTFLNRLLESETIDYTAIALSVSQSQVDIIGQKLTNLSNIGSLDIEYDGRDIALKDDYQKKWSFNCENLKQVKRLEVTNYHNTMSIPMKWTCFPMVEDLWWSVNYDAQKMPDSLFLPRGIKHLKNVEKLILRSGNYKPLSRIEEPMVLPNLKELNIRNLGIEGILSYFNMETVCSLKIDNGDSLTQISDEVYNLTNLEELIIIGPITSLSDSIGKMKSLKKLYISGSALSVLPDALAKLENLEVLDISDGELKEFPEVVLKMKKLKVLALNNHKMKTIPKELKRLTRLRSIRFDGNDFTEEYMQQLRKRLRWQFPLAYYIDIWEDYTPRTKRRNERLFERRQKLMEEARKSMNDS